MDHNFEVVFSVYLDEARMVSQSNLDYVKTTVRAAMPQQAQAMVEAQYNGRARIWSVVQK